MVTNMTDTLTMAVCFAVRNHKDGRIIFYFPTFSMPSSHRKSLYCKIKYVGFGRKMCTRARCDKSDIVEGSRES